MKFETNESIKDKVNARLGWSNIKKASDVIHRADYATEEEYIDACVSYRQKMSDPAYRQERQAVQAELSEAQEKEARQRQREQFKSDLQGVKLSSDELSRAGERAQAKAKRDLTDGKIAPADYADSVLSYTESESQALKEDRVINSQMNGWLRSGWQSAKENGGEFDGIG